LLSLSTNKRQQFINNCPTLNDEKKKISLIKMAFCYNRDASAIVSNLYFLSLSQLDTNIKNIYEEKILNDLNKPKSDKYLAAKAHKHHPEMTIVAAIEMALTNPSTVWKQVKLIKFLKICFE
jgi:hypothetical protein